MSALPGVKPVCKLLYCELLKYKRTKVIPLLTALSALFPLALLGFTGSDLRGAGTLAEQRAYYDSLFNNSLVYSSLLLFPCLFGCISAILFFTERDCDTFKNLRVVPVTRNALIFAKLGALYLWSVVYSVCSVLSATLFCLLCQPAAVYDVPFKVLCSIVTAIAMATVSLPVVVIVVYQNQNYVLSSLLSFLYAVANWLLLIIFSSNDSALLWLPIMNGFLFTSRLWGWRKAALGLAELAPLSPGMYLHVALYLAALFLLSVVLIVHFYKKWSR